MTAKAMRAISEGPALVAGRATREIYAIWNQRDDQAPSVVLRGWPQYLLCLADTRLRQIYGYLPDSSAWGRSALDSSSRAAFRALVRSRMNVSAAAFITSAGASRAVHHPNCRHA